MEQPLDRSPLEGQQIDPETFRRVWARVMPDQSRSPIRVDPPTRKKESPAPMPSSRPERERFVHSQPSEQKEEETLGRLMDLARAGVLEGNQLVPRAGAYGRTIANVADSRRRGLKRLSAAQFLLTGRRHISQSSPPVRTIPLDVALREQFLWEQQWIRECLQGAERTGDQALEELYRDLARDGEARQRVIRRMLEQL